MKFCLRALTILAVAALAGCASGNPPPVTTQKAKAVSAFHQALADHRIDFAPPAEGKAILVNVPAFELVAFEDGAPVLRSRVIVGSRRNPTPLLDTYTTVVRFRPSWRPTPSMVQSGEYPDRRWPPGRKNPLGLAAIRLEPGLLVYLHDTNRRSLFEREDRALSHGCIRVQRWDALIAWLAGIDLATVHRHAEGRRTFDMEVAPVPVMIRYYTTFPADDGTVHVHDDVYGREAQARSGGSAPAKRGAAAAECTML